TLLRTRIGAPLGITGRETCDPKQMRLTGLDAALADTLAPFLRLHVRTGFAIADLDQAVAMLDEAALLELGRFEGLRAETALPIDELSAWFRALRGPGD